MDEAYGRRRKSTEGVKLSGVRKDGTVCGHISGESLTGAEGARSTSTSYLSGKRTELRIIYNDADKRI